MSERKGARREISASSSLFSTDRQTCSTPALGSKRPLLTCASPWEGSLSEVCIARGRGSPASERAGSSCLRGGGEEQCVEESERAREFFLFLFSCSRSRSLHFSLDILELFVCGRERKKSTRQKLSSSDLSVCCSRIASGLLLSRTMMLQSAGPLRHPALSSTARRGRSSTLTTRALFGFGKESESAREKRLEKEEQFRIQQEVLQSRKSGSWKKVRKKREREKEANKHGSVSFVV